MPPTRLAELFPDRFYQLATRQAMGGRHPVVVAPAIHYATPEDRLKYDIVQSIRTLTLLRQAHPAKSLDGARHFRLPLQMFTACKEHPEWLIHSQELAERCRFEMPFGKPQFPPFQPPDGSSAHDYLHRLVQEGLRRRYGNRAPAMRSQVEQELRIISAVG